MACTGSTGICATVNILQSSNQISRATRATSRTNRATRATIATRRATLVTRATLASTSRRASCDTTARGDVSAKPARFLRAQQGMSWYVLWHFCRIRQHTSACPTCTARNELVCAVALLPYTSAYICHNVSMPYVHSKE